MNLTIPIYVHFHRDQYTVRPLFFPNPVQRHEKLERVLHLLSGDLRQILRELGKTPRHDALAAWTFCPDLDYHRVDVVVELRKRLARGRYFFVVFHTLGRRVAFTPTLPEVWFELGRGESLLDRATEVLTAEFRRREKEEEDDFVAPEEFALHGTAWITTLDLEIYPAQRLKEEEKDRRASLVGDDDNPDGERELFRIGRCLDQLYPDDLDRVMLREREVQELSALLQVRDRRPVLLLGPPLVGKTALLHEHVWRAVDKREERHKVLNYTWLLSPQRLISGMSYVGQWEKRLLAILKEADRKNHTLYFDDFLGLYYAGRTSQSELCAADVMKPYVERQEVRILAEMTPEAFRVLRERDRGFADLFHVLPLEEPAPRDVLRILVAAQRQLEYQHRCRFDLDVLTSVLDLQRRYVRHLSFPGKAALFQRRLAVKYRRGAVARKEVLQEFHAQSGLSLTFLDNREKLSADSVVAAMEQQVIGQPGALEACAEVVSIAKARLNDPERPLAAFLFLGPTGVGKTQCAKALSAYLFGDADKLLRFDMNEFNEPGSAARLVGTFFQPEGLLTAAIRRQPFAVVLLDEIEKADPEVFDLLLQVLGEGRLTDALGRTADFCNAIVILTSNLGVREASATLGYGSRDGHDRAAYTRAAERFFRPEFFNRIDRVVAFERLSRADVSRIAHILLTDLLKREGLIRRKCLLRVEDAALERIVDQGFDPVLGARALKRALERQLAQPVASALAAGIPEGLTVVHVYTQGDGLGVSVRVLEQVEPLPGREQAQKLLADRPLFLERARAALRRIEEQFAHYRPGGEITAGSLADEHVIYYAIQEELHGIKTQLLNLADRIEQEKLAGAKLAAHAVSPVGRSSKASRVPRSQIDFARRRNLLGELASAQDMWLFIEDLAAAASARPVDQRWPDPLGDLALAEVVAECSREPQPAGALVLVWSVGGGRKEVPARPGRRSSYEDDHYEDDYYQDDRPRQMLVVSSDWDYPLALALVDLFGDLHLEPRLLNGLDGVVGVPFVVSGPTAWRLVQQEEGTHLFCPKHGGLVAVQVCVWPLRAEDDPAAILRDVVARRRQWQEKLARGAATLDDEPQPLRPVRRIYNEGGTMVDVRTGLVESTLHLMPAFALAALPLPPEVAGS